MMGSKGGDTRVISDDAGGTMSVATYWRSARAGSAGSSVGTSGENLTVPGAVLGDTQWFLQRSGEELPSVTALSSWHGCGMTAASAPSANSVQELAANAVWHSGKRMAASRETTNLGSRLIFMLRMLSEPLGDCKWGRAAV